jgi:hypothetical protein
MWSSNHADSWDKIKPRQACFKSLAVHLCRDPAVAVSVDQRAQRREQFGILGHAVIRSPTVWPTRFTANLRRVTTAWATFTPSCKISFSNVFLPKTRCSSRTYFCSARSSAFYTTSSFARMASFPPLLIGRLRPKTRLGAILWRRAT